MVRPTMSGVNTPGSSGVVVRSEVGTPGGDDHGVGGGVISSSSGKGKSRSRSRERGGKEESSVAGSGFEEGVGGVGSERSGMDLTVEGDGQSGLLVVGQEEDGEETFPLPFDAPGGDVT